MHHLVSDPVIIPGVGEKLIEEYFGHASTGDPTLSIARMVAPPGWEEPGQTPEFAEYTVVLKGELIVESREGEQVVPAGKGVLTPAGDWVRYRVGDKGAEYIAVCLPAFSPNTVHRDGE